KGIVEQTEPTRTAAGGVRRVAAEDMVRQRQAVVTFGLGELGVFTHDRAIAADVAERQGYSEMHGRFPFLAGRCFPANLYISTTCAMASASASAGANQEICGDQARI